MEWLDENLFKLAAYGDDKVKSLSMAVQHGDGLQIFSELTAVYGELDEVIFLKGPHKPKAVLVFVGGVGIRVGTDSYIPILTFGYQGQGPAAFTAFLAAAGFLNTDAATIVPPVRVDRDGTRMSGESKDGQVAWKDGTITPLEGDKNPAARPLGTELESVFAAPLATKSFILTKRCQKYLLLRDVFNRDAKRFVIVVQEPHWDHNAQWNLLLGLDQFFVDNPELFAASLFITEGYPKRVYLPIWDLFRMSPENDAEILRSVLRSYLIPGHVTYAWCAGGVIPVVGGEDWDRYCRSAELWAQSGENDLWEFSVVARNQALAISVSDCMANFENPMLFVGGRHLLRINENDYQRGLLNGAWGRGNIQNIGVVEVLRAHGCGVVYLEPVADVADASDLEGAARYRRLFRAQLSGDYTAYRTDCMTLKLCGGRVTVSPNVGEAMAFVSSLRKSAAQGKGAGGGGFDLRGLPRRLAGVLRAALRGQGNFGVGKASRRIAEMLGRAWVGADGRPSTDGKAFVSKDGNFDYRPASDKNPNPSGGGKHIHTTQANFRRRDQNGQWHNAHLTVTD